MDHCTAIKILNDKIVYLSIISKIKEKQKLGVYINDIKIYSDSWSDWISRKWYRQTKEDTIMFLKELYNTISQSVHLIISDINEKDMSNETKISLINILINLVDTLRLSITGLENLSKTYAESLKTVANIENLVRETVMPLYKKIIKAIPDEYHKDDMLNNIIFMDKVIYYGTRNAENHQIGNPYVNTINNKNYSLPMNIQQPSKLYQNPFLNNTPPNLYSSPQNLYSSSPVTSSSVSSSPLPYSVLNNQTSPMNNQTPHVNNQTPPVNTEYEISLINDLVDP